MPTDCDGVNAQAVAFVGITLEKPITPGENHFRCGSAVQVFIGGEKLQTKH